MNGLQARADIVPPAQAIPLPTPLTLTDAIAIALKEQPQTAIANSQTANALALKSENQAAYFPTVTPTFNYIQQNSHNSARSGQTGFSGQPVSSSSDTSEGQVGVVVDEDLYDNGVREIANAQARRTLAADQANQENVYQNTILSVTQAYCNLLKSTDLVRVSNLEIDRARQEIDMTQAEITAGTAARSDIFQPRADLASALVSLSQNETLVATTASQLKLAMGIISDFPLQPAALAGTTAPEPSLAPDVAADPTRRLVPPATESGSAASGPANPAASATPGTSTGIDLLPPVPVVGAPKTIDQLFQVAEMRRPDLQQLEQLYEVQKLNARAAEINAGLRVNGTYEFTYFNNNGSGPEGTDSTAMLSLTYPLFDAGASRDAVRAARELADVAADQYEAQRQSIRSAIEQDAINRAGGLQQTRLARAAVVAAQESYDATVAQRGAGLATNFDVVTVEVTLTQAEDAYVADLYTFYFYDAALQRDLGLNESAPLSVDYTHPGG